MRGNWRADDSVLSRERVRNEQQRRCQELTAAETDTAQRACAASAVARGYRAQRFPNRQFSPPPLTGSIVAVVVVILR